MTARQKAAEDTVGLKGKYAWAMKVSQDVHFNGSVEERDGKLHMRGTVNTQDEANQLWNAIKTIPDRPNEIVADIKATGAAPAAASGSGQAATYTVQPGDTLSKIAKHHLGDANAYMDIFNANRDQLSDPDKIKPGQVLKLPQPANR
jgi:LysM repeat protein